MRTQFMTGLLCTFTMAGILRKSSTPPAVMGRNWKYHNYLMIWLKCVWLDGIFPLELTWVLTITYNSFGWEYKPKSSLCTHAFHCKESKDPDIQVLDGWMLATSTLRMHHRWRQNLTTPMVKLKKQSHMQKSHPKWWNPETLLGMQKKKMYMAVLYLVFSGNHTLVVCCDAHWVQFLLQPTERWLYITESLLCAFDFLFVHTYTGGWSTSRFAQVSIWSIGKNLTCEVHWNEIKTQFKSSTLSPPATTAFSYLINKRNH